MAPRDNRNSEGAGAALTALRATSESRFVLRLFGVTAGLFTAAASLAAVLTLAFPQRVRPDSGTFIVPIAFAFSTALLLACSVALQRAIGAVRRERQRTFRRALLAAVACGTGFVGVQIFGLWRIVQNLQLDRNAGEAQLGAAMLVLGAAALHALHVSVALMVLVYVTLRGLNDRYDHEYSFGVAACAWFWHILGFLWLFILGAYGVVSLFLTIRIPA
jgi:cytochrome c oxidase subunit 3